MPLQANTINTCTKYVRSGNGRSCWEDLGQGGPPNRQWVLSAGTQEEEYFSHADGKEVTLFEGDREVRIPHPGDKNTGALKWVTKIESD